MVLVTTQLDSLTKQHIIGDQKYTVHMFYD